MSEIDVKEVRAGVSMCARIVGLLQRGYFPGASCEEVTQAIRFLNHVKESTKRQLKEEKVDNGAIQEDKKVA